MHQTFQRSTDAVLFAAKLITLEISTCTIERDKQVLSKIFWDFVMFDLIQHNQKGIHSM